VGIMLGIIAVMRLMGWALMVWKKWIQLFASSCRSFTTILLSKCTKSIIANIGPTCP
jgi:hypothetical protein